MKVFVQPENDSFARGGDAGGFLALGENLKQHLRAAAVELHVAQLIDAQQIHPAVAGDGLGELAFVGGFDEFVDQFGGQGVADACCAVRRVSNSS